MMRTRFGQMASLLLLAGLSACANGEPLSLEGALDAASHKTVSSFPIGRRTVELRQNLGGKYSLDVIGTNVSSPIESTQPVLEQVIDTEAANSRLAVIRGPSFNCPTRYQFVDYVHSGNYRVLSSQVPGCDAYHVSRYNDSSVLISDSNGQPVMLYQGGKYKRIVPDSHGSEAQNRSVGIIPARRQATTRYGHLQEVQTPTVSRVTTGNVVNTGSSTVSLD
ncbi:hypothetical protein AD929_02345 [Gluconobacter potus]|uniref:Lipoprotein n=2 Tax=Gluconobacter potus TaxID=2724927 RepID=A0A149QZ10_9PROT|nr:hypothetical protein AD929_02345 [Gluconobacter potus]